MSEAEETKVEVSPFLEKDTAYYGITPDELRMIGEMRRAVDSEADGSGAAVFPAGGAEGGCPNEIWLLKFLRARKLVLEDALAMCRETWRWRQRNKVAELFANPPSNYPILQKLIPQGRHGYDKEGAPVYWKRCVWCDTMCCSSSK